MRRMGIARAVDATRGLMWAAADYDSSGGNDVQLASRRSTARMSIPARQELICDPVFQMFRRATYIILMDEGTKDKTKGARCRLIVWCVGGWLQRQGVWAGEDEHSFPSPVLARVCVGRGDFFTSVKWSYRRLGGSSWRSPSGTGRRHRSCRRSGRNWPSRSWWRHSPGSADQWRILHTTAPSGPGRKAEPLGWTLPEETWAQSVFLGFFRFCFFSFSGTVTELMRDGWSNNARGKTTHHGIKIHWHKINRQQQSSVYHSFKQTGHYTRYSNRGRRNNSFSLCGLWMLAKTCSASHQRETGNLIHSWTKTGLQTQAVGRHRQKIHWQRRSFAIRTIRNQSRLLFVQTFFFFFSVVMLCLLC